MTHKNWSAVGYYQISPTDLLVLPIFAEDDDQECYAQFTFSSSSQYFELNRVDTAGFCRFSEPLPVNPKRVLYIGLRIRGNIEVVERRKAHEYLDHISFDHLEDAAKIQFLDLIGSSVASLRVNDTRLKLDDHDFSFLPTLSAQDFIDQALTHAKEDANKASIAREIVSCSRWVNDWTLGRIPENKLTSLLSKLSISEAELEVALREVMANSVDRFDSPRHDAEVDIIETMVDAISRLGRQELRIAQMLRMIVLDVTRGRRVIRRYDPRTKYENLIMPILDTTAHRAMGSDQHTRELMVAKVIPKIFVKYFPVRRGRFLVDFMRVLGDFSVIKEQMVSMYHQKVHTYGVQLYSNVIEKLIDDDDDAAEYLRRPLI